MTDFPLTLEEFRAYCEAAPSLLVGTYVLPSDCPIACALRDKTKMRWEVGVLNAHAPNGTSFPLPDWAKAFNSSIDWGEHPDLAPELTGKYCLEILDELFPEE